MMFKSAFTVFLFIWMPSYIDFFLQNRIPWKNIVAIFVIHKFAPYFTDKIKVSSLKNKQKQLTIVNNSSTIADELFERLWPFCGVGA